MVESFINWSGFVGAWLLVAGSVYQAALELSEANDAPGHDRESRERAMASVPLPARISPWWWLLPPVGYVLNRRRTERFRREVIRHMDPESLRGMVEFGRKATSWLLVATGGFAIAIKETFELGDHLDWPIAVFWVLVVLMPLVAFSYTVINLRRTERYLRAQAAS